jgi:hypothetical protein
MCDAGILDGVPTWFWMGLSLVVGGNLGFVVASFLGERREQ